MRLPTLSGRLIAVWLLFVTMAVTIGVLEYDSFVPKQHAHRSDAESTNSSGEKARSHGGRERVFRFSEPTLGAVEISFRGHRTTLMRDHQGLWFNHGDAHQHATQKDAQSGHHHSDGETAEAIRKQIDVSTRMLADRRIEPERVLQEYGLAAPTTTFTFYPRKGNEPDFAKPLSVLYVGDLLTTNYAYYTRIDGEQQITLIPRYQVALLLATAFGEDVAPAPLPKRANES